ncbi:MAG: DUF928 domain-containing protein [Cyanobacteria bacterium J06656_5]
MNYTAPLASVLALTVSFTGSAAQAQQTARASDTNYLAQIVFSNKTDPADGFTGTGRPVSRTSGGSRGECDHQLVALLPGTDDLQMTAGCTLQSTAELALTTSVNPTVWVHVPELDSPLQGQFALLDESQQALSIAIIMLPETASIVGIPVDTTLEIGQTYYWVFSILETPERPTENPRVEGLIQRIEPTRELITALDNTDNLRDQAEIWASHGIWHEALTNLANLQQTAPGDANQQDWHSFLESVGLGAIANTPIQP